MSLNQPTSYLAPALAGCKVPGKGGHRVIAVRSVAAGSLLAVMGGEVVDGETLAQFSPERVRRTMQVEEDLYLWSSQEGPADWINHSCEPNAGFRGQVSVVAMRDIEAGEEVCFDYAMCDGTPYDEFECACGSSLCRGQVTGDDWRRPDLWDRYDGYFSPYLQMRIDRLKKSDPLWLRYGPLIHV